MKKLNNKFDSLLGGIQIQNRYRGRGIGTLACIVFDIETGIPLGLSNKHILKKKIGSDVIQPARKRRTEEFLIGKVFRKGNLKGKPGDCAVFKLDINLRDYDRQNSIFGLNGIIKEIAEAQEGMKVQKVGQKTGHTYGIIKKINKDGTFAIKPNPQKMNGQISIGGDSGSLWITDEKDFKAVGLHVSGEKQKKYFWQRKRKDKATAIKIQLVIEQLQIKF